MYFSNSQDYILEAHIYVSPRQLHCCLNLCSLYFKEAKLELPYSFSNFKIIHYNV